MTLINVLMLELPAFSTTENKLHLSVE